MSNRLAMKISVVMFVGIPLVNTNSSVSNWLQNIRWRSMRTYIDAMLVSLFDMRVMLKPNGL